MKGIDILNKTEIMTNPELFYLFSFLSFIFLLSGMIAIFYGSFQKSINILILGLIMFGLFIVLIFTVVSKEDTEPTGRYRYEVIIDDSVSFLSIQEKYDIIEQNGRIWTLEDKEVENE